MLSQFILAIIIFQLIINHGSLLAQNMPVTRYFPASARCEERGLTMSLREVGLRRIDSDFASSSNISCLDLEGNEIDYVAPAALRSMRNLIYLSLARNKLSLTNFSSLDGHFSLRNLVLDESANEESGVTLEFKNEFPRLLYLHLRGNNLKDVSSLNFAPRLSYLYLSSNDFEDSELAFVKNASNLVVLDLANSSISHGNISFLNRLEELQLDDNRIKRICGKCPDDSAIVLEGLISLKRFSCARNDLESVEPDVFENTEFLEDLDLSHNQIDTIRKETFENTASLINLTLNDNLLTEMPDLGKLQHLENLNLSNNRLEALSNDTLYMNRMLKTIDLSNNAIHTIMGGAFDRQEHLEFLNLSKNRLSTFPNTWLLYMADLRVLLLNGNLVADLYDLKLGSIKNNAKLERVDLRNNSITVFSTRSMYHSLRPNPNVTLVLFDEKDPRECAKCECNEI